MTNEVSLPAEFKAIMKEKILTAFMGMIPQDKIDDLMNKEIDAFFNFEGLLTIKETTVIIDNPNYNQKGSYYDNKKEISVPSLVLGSKMTPFRQLAWSTIHEYLKPKLVEVLNDSNSQAKKELDKLIAEEYKPKTEETFKAIFTETAKTMSATMFYRSMSSAIEVSHLNMRNSLNSVGINPSNNAHPLSPMVQI